MAGLNTKPEKIPWKSLLLLLFPMEHLQLNSWEKEPLSPKWKGKLLKSQRIPLWHCIQS